MPSDSGANTGQIIEIKGVVIDAVFPDRLPEILHAVQIEVPRPDGTSSTLIAEVQQHLGDDRVRAVAMDSTDGLARGADVIDTGGPITVPVGRETLLPLQEATILESPDDDEDEGTGHHALVEYEPGPEEILERLIPDYVEISLYRALLESTASELGARMTAMRNASQNAAEVIDDLTLEMNRARQAEITQEIMEVVAGAEALV